MDILLWLVLGGIAGWIASMIMGADARMGIFANVIVGVIGAALGGFLASMLGIGGVSGFNLMSFITAILGAVLLLWIIQMFSGTGRTSGRTL
jgi:uncharacterized membrane protein YeaQ/YmgE (transglycosylase-associated protein family)